MRYDSILSRLSSKYLLSLQMGLLLYVSSLAQHDRQFWNEKIDIHDFGRDIIGMAPPGNRIMLRNIHDVTVIDVRPDTTAIGFMQRSAQNRRFIVLKNGLRDETAHFIREYLEFNPSDSAARVVMVIKKLWLSDELEPAVNNLTGIKSPEEEENSWTGGIRVKIEFYLNRQQEYYPIYRFDTTLSRSLRIAENGPEFMRSALIASLEKMIRIEDYRPGSYKRILTWPEILEYNNQSYRLPILQDTVLHAGVYLGYDEFKNNQPSQKEFEVKMSKMVDDIYIRQPDGKYHLERNVWGYCDGKNCYIKSANNYFRFQRICNAYYIYGAKYIGRKQGGIQPGPAVSSSASMAETPGGTVIYDKNKKNFYKMIFKPFLLDWDTGKLY